MMAIQEPLSRLILNLSFLVIMSPRALHLNDNYGLKSLSEQIQEILSCCLAISTTTEIFMTSTLISFVKTPLYSILTLSIFQSKKYKRQGLPDAPVVEEVIFPFDADYIEKHSMRRWKKRTARYIIATPITDYTVSTKLQYRNLPPYLLRALQLDDLVPRLQVFTLDEFEITVQ